MAVFSTKKVVRTLLPLSFGTSRGKVSLGYSP